jgi:hypothetical protein
MFKFLKRKKQEEVPEDEIEKSANQEIHPETPAGLEIKEGTGSGEKYLRDEMRIHENSGEEFQVMEEKEKKMKRQDSEWMIYAIVVVFLVILVAAATFLALRWNLLSEKEEKKSEDQPSITEIAENEKLAQMKDETPEEPEVNVENLENQPEASTQTAIAPAQVQVKVLNGGAAPGTAGKVRDLLNSKGYTKAAASNSALENFTGQTIFFQEGNDATANAIKEILIVQYPNTVTKPASTSEEKSATIVVMVGK